jgi:hypothetical protein
MGAWGDGLLQSDGDLDVVDEMGPEMGLDPLWHCPDDPDHVRRELDDGKFSAKFAELRKQQTAYHGWADPKYALILLTAVAMGLGVTITDDKRTYLEKLVLLLSLQEQAHGDMMRALREYKSGTPYRVAGPGLIETAFIKFGAASSSQN